MSVTAAYATPAEYRKAIGSLDSADDDLLTLHLEAISRYFERETGQFFTQDAANVDRIYLPKAGRPSRPDWAESENPWKYGGQPRVLDIDNLVTLASIKLDTVRDGTYATTLTTSDYELLPRNAALGPEPMPYRQIELQQTGTYYAWPQGVRVKVTGKFGWPSVPAAVKSAVIELCGIWRAANPRATGRMNELDQLTTTSPMAMSLIKRVKFAYMKVPSF